MKASSTRLTLLASLAALMAGPALAHTGAGHASGLTAGLLHPLLGLDHLLAMLAVGLWSGFALRRDRVWLGALSFVAAMALGAGIGFAGHTLPLVETIIAVSVVALGAMIVLASRDHTSPVVLLSLAAIAGFAVFHGIAHASEAEGDAHAYVAGFLISTALLHVAGIVVAWLAADRAMIQRSFGAAIAVAGLLMFG